uniref:hypothetical protein n=1 Tax=Streptomyces dangxiongensis TaxID=1442032 RepID=UPI0037436571
MTRPAPWRRAAVFVALMLAAFTFNTAENLPVGLLEPISESLRVSVPAVGLLITGYGGTVAVASRGTFLAGELLTTGAGAVLSYPELRRISLMTYRALAEMIGLVVR